jgi:hypothetical protein
MTTDLQTQAKAALQGVIASMPTEGKMLSDYLAALHQKNIVALGEDEAFALRDGGGSGEIKAFKQRLVLSIENGGLVQPVFGGPHVVSAQGYEKWSEASGTCVIFPKTVTVDGVEQANPHVIRDPHNRRILNIYARAIAFRFSSKGLPMVRDWTTTYDVPSYRLIDLVAKAKKYPQAFRLLPADLARPAEDGTWGAYPFDETMTLWVNSAHEEALKWYGEILNREKKALDFAQTFAARNACKHLSGLQKAPGPVWNLEVICWRPTTGSLMKWDTTVYASLQDRIEGLGAGHDFAALPEAQKGMVIDLRRGAERMDEEEPLIAAEDEESAPAATEAAPLDLEQNGNGSYGQAEPAEETGEVADPEDVTPTLSAEDQKVMANYEAARENFPDLDVKARRRMSIKPDAVITPDKARALAKEISRLVDQDAG